MKPESPAVLAAATAVFGDRLELAERYVESLATDGVIRGIIGPREVDRLWERHILNCAVIERLIPEHAHVVDVGSGGGLPGIPLAIARPDLRVSLVEPMLRRTQYLADVTQELGLGVEIVRGRAEQPGVLHEVGGADVVTSRAVAPLDKLLTWCMPLLRQGGTFIALKGAAAAEEMQTAGKVTRRLLVENMHLEVCGEGLLEAPTTTVVATRGARRARK